jgi:hypothetical protein
MPLDSPAIVNSRVAEGNIEMEELMPQSEPLHAESQLTLHTMYGKLSHARRRDLR